MRRVGWKLFTIAAIAFAATDVMGPSALPLNPANALLGIPALVGLVGYSWSLTIGPRWIWKIVFCLETLLLFALGGFVLWMVGPALPTSRFLAAGLLFAIGMSVAKLYALYRYGFGSSPPWSAVQPAAAAVRGRV